VGVPSIQATEVLFGKEVAASLNDYGLMNFKTTRLLHALAL
jgi:hypothetical protein